MLGSNVEYWNKGWFLKGYSPFLIFSLTNILPIKQYYIIPVFHHSNWGEGPNYHR